MRSATLRSSRSSTMRPASSTSACDIECTSNMPNSRSTIWAPGAGFGGLDGDIHQPEDLVAGRDFDVERGHALGGQVALGDGADKRRILRLHAVEIGVDAQLKGIRPWLDPFPVYTSTFKPQRHREPEVYYEPAQYSSQNRGTEETAKPEPALARR